MNSGNNKTGSINAFDFDLGLNSGRSKSLNDKKSQTSSYTYVSPQQNPNTTSSWAHQPTKPAWTHQPAVQSGLTGSLSGPTSMVGDIHGKSWNSTATSNSGGIGIVNNKNPNLFSDLLGSAMGQNRSSSNVPLKNSAPVSSQSTFSMGGVADSLPKTGYSGQNSGNLGSNVGQNGGNVGFGGIFGQSSNLGGNFGQSLNLGGGFGNLGVNGNKNSNLGGASLKSMGGSKDPFVSLVDFGSTPNSGINSASKESVKSGFGNDPFGDFQEATSKTSPSSPMDDFVFSNSQTQSQNQPPVANNFDVLFSDSGVKQFSETDDWGSEFVGGDDNGPTTELDGLPPPPAGVSASSAKNKGMDNYKQGQFADAIKWLSWAIVLLDKARDDGGAMEVLTCRASCYKEVGEYKKAVADCTKVLEHDGTNVSVLVQRALLYESMEKYKLGAEDLRTVMKIDPGNRVARSTVHRLTKMAQ